MASEEEVEVIDLRKMRIPELKKELQLRSLKTSGNKQELIERLEQYLEEHEGAEVADDEILQEEEGETEDNLIDDQKIEDAVLTVPAKEKLEAEETKTDVAAPDAEVKEGNKEEDSVTKLNSVALSDAEKLKLRAQKFGMSVTDMNADARKAARSQRFGTGSAVGAAPTADAEMLKKRAERFGVVVSDTLSKSEDEERRRKRQARFGSDSSSAAGVEDVDKKKKRAERFGLTA